MCYLLTDSYRCGFCYYIGPRAGLSSPSIEFQSVEDCVGLSAADKRTHGANDEYKLRPRRRRTPSTTTVSGYVLPILVPVHLLLLLQANKEVDNCLRGCIFAK